MCPLSKKKKYLKKKEKKDLKKKFLKKKKKMGHPSYLGSVELLESNLFLYRYKQWLIAYMYM